MPARRRPKRVACRGAGGQDRFGDKAPLVDPLGGLLEGTTVVVRDGPPLSDTAANDEESDRTGVSEATVIQIENAGAAHPPL